MPELTQEQLEYKRWLENFPRSLQTKEGRKNAMRLVFYALGTGEKGKTHRRQMMKFDIGDTRRHSKNDENSRTKEESICTDFVFSTWIMLINGYDLYEGKISREDVINNHLPPPTLEIISSMSDSESERSVFERMFANSIFLVFKKVREETYKNIKRQKNAAAAVECLNTNEIDASAQIDTIKDESLQVDDKAVQIDEYEDEFIEDGDEPSQKDVDTIDNAPQRNNNQNLQYDSEQIKKEKNRIAKVFKFLVHEQHQLASKSVLDRLLEAETQDEEKDKLIFLSAFLAHLKEKDAQLFELLNFRYYGEMTYKEISEQTDIPPNTVYNWINFNNNKSKIFRILAEFKKWYKPGY